MAASQAGHVQCAKHLIAGGAALDAAAEDGVTALLAACGQGHDQVCKLLSMSGASRSPTSSGLTPVDIARLLHHEELARWLHLSTDWCTPLHHVSILSRDDTLRLLRDGANLHARARPAAPTPIDVAMKIAEAEGGSPSSDDSSAQLVLMASRRWSPRQHALFPAPARAHAVELLLLGHRLLASPLGGGSTAVLDVWVDRIMPQIVRRHHGVTAV